VRIAFEASWRGKEDEELMLGQSRADLMKMDEESFQRVFDAYEKYAEAEREASKLKTAASDAGHTARCADIDARLAAVLVLAEKFHAYSKVLEIKYFPRGFGKSGESR
jgi:uncharacterized protein YifE (UPF0438 family)